MPSEIELAKHILRQALEAEARENALEVVAMEHVELGERNAPGPHLLHAGLILAPPGIGEAEPIERVAARLEQDPGLARNAGPPIHQRAENVKKQSFHGDRHGWLATSRDRRFARG